MLNSEYKLSKSSVQSQQPLKSYKKQPSNHGVHCPILILAPSETLTAITSYLDPPSLSALAVVNKYLNGHVKDDNTWRRAFFYQFLGIDPENDLDESKALLLRRTESSWRNEFTVRYKLKRRWERSRNAVVTHVPVNSSISSMHVMPSHALLTSSIQYGIVARSLPLTGKILPGYLDTSGGAHVGLGIGNPNAEFTPNISACAISSDGGTAKIIWGTKTGDVIFMTAPKAMNGGRRNAADVRRCDIADKHDGSVLDAQWVVNPPSTALGWAVVTASVDGRVKLWNPKTAVCQWTSQRKASAHVPDPCLKVTATQTGIHGGCIAAVMKSGEIHIWTGFALGSTAIYEGNSIRETIIDCLVPNITRGHNPQVTHAVIALHIDPTRTSPTLLVAYENDPFFYRIRVGSQPRTGPEEDTDVDITTFGDPFFGSTSIIVPYFRGTAEQRASFVFVGDHLGWVSLYAWDADNPSLRVSNSISTSLTTNTSANDTTIQAIRKFEAHPDSASVTALTWSPHTLITGSAKGTTHVFDALNFRHLRSFASPIPKTRGRHQAVGGDDAAAEMDRRKVKQIIVGTGLGAPVLNNTSGSNSKDKALSLEEDRDLVFISVGERVMAWKAGPVPEHGLGGVRGRHIQGVLGAGRKKRGGYAKYLQQLELNQIILGSRRDHHQLLLDEAKHKNLNSFNSIGSSKHARETEREQRERLEHLGLSEAEAVEYVLMLSRDEANTNARAEGGSGTSTFETQLETDQGLFEGDFDTATDNDEEDDYNQSFTHSTVSGSRRSSTSIPTASSSHSSSSTSLSSHSSHSNLMATTRLTTTRSTTIAVHRSVPRPIPSSSNEKIQVSPPFRSEPMEAGQEWLGGNNNSTSGDGDTSMREAHIFPPIVPSGSGNMGNEAQGDSGKEKEKSALKGRKKNKDTKDNIEDTRKNEPRERNQATTAEIPSPSPSPRCISNADVGSSRTVKQNALTPSSPSSITSSKSSSAWNVPLSMGHNYGQRGSIGSRPSSTSTSASAPAIASTAPRNAWASGGPSLSARISSPTVAATASLQSQLYHPHQQ